MKKITVTMSDKVFAELRTHMGFKCMCDEVYGMPDAVIFRIIRAIDNGDSEVGIKMKEEKDDDGVQNQTSDSS